MYKHHREAIQALSDKFYQQDEISGLIIGGSIAHGFATEKSDVDIMLVIPDDLYEARLKAGDLTYWEIESCNYEHGYVDGKYICEGFINKVAEYGSEPAKFAFKDTVVAFSKVEGLQQKIDNASRYPIDQKKDKIGRFYAQLNTWKWYCVEAIKSNNVHLLNHSVSNLVTAGGRLILAYNEVLFPYHKWFRKVIEQLSSKPDNFMEMMEKVYAFKDAASIEGFYQCVNSYQAWETLGDAKLSQFILDSELSWLDGKVAIFDI